MAKKAKKKKFTLSSFTIIMLIIVAIAITSYLLPLWVGVNSAVAFNTRRLSSLS